MTVEFAKQEMVKRYKYLYENSYFILAPYMYEQTEEEFEKMCEENLNKYDDCLLKKPLIYLNINRLDSVNSIFEEFLLSEESMEESFLYRMVESNKNNKDYLDMVKNGLELLEKDNRDISLEMFKERIDILRLLGKVSEYIDEQSGDLDNKRRKLEVLDEYYRIFRYQNNGVIYKSGRKLILAECGSMIVSRFEKKPSRDKKDIGVKNNTFISTILSIPYYEDNYSIFTEKEKQQIYLEYHDELPCDLETVCKFEDEINTKKIEMRLYRPHNTLPCGENFIIKEEEIFVDPMSNLYRYYQLCPHCGYIVNIPNDILSEGIKKRIEDRCSIDDKLFRKMFLYSELFSLDKNSSKGQRKLLKK